MGQHGQAVARAGRGGTHAEKSADPVAAKVASGERRACQTAPLWPMKVPILDMVSESLPSVLLLSPTSPQ